MGNLGPNSTQQLALPTYWDAAYLKKFQLASGMDYARLVSLIQSGLGAAASAVLNDPLNASLISLTTDPSMEYEVNATNTWESHTEYGRPEPRRAVTTGHILPFDPYDFMLGFTWDFLRKASQAQVQRNVGLALRGYKDLCQKKILSRLFKSTYTAVATGRSMPLADGGTADSSYIPMAYPERGGTFLYTHDHIHHIAATNQAALEDAVTHLWEHGYDAPYDLLVSEADLSTWTATATITGFKPPASGLIQYGQDTTLATVDRAQYIGVVDTAHGEVRIRATGRLATTYWALYKSFGPLDERNPLAVLTDDNGVAPRLIQGDHIREFPLENAMLFAEFGVGVANRIGAVLRKVDGGAWADPTIA